MRVFVTGATGFIGHTVVRELLKNGHQVTGLVRSAEKGRELESAGASAVVGDLKEPGSYLDAATRHHTLIHTAFEYSPAAVDADRAAVDTLLEAARSGDGMRHVIYTSGIWVLGATGDTPAYEDAPTDHPAPLVAWRVEHERRVLGADSDHLAAAAIRPGMVYGHQGSLVADYFKSAEKDGASRYIGDGRNRIPLIHVDDLARLYRTVVEQRARGIFHAVDGVPVPMIEVAKAASEAAGKEGATRSVSIEEARQKMGPVADAMVLDQIVLSRRSSELGWRPQYRSFPEDARRAYEEWKGAAGKN